MSVSEEELAAFADGELSGADKQRLAAAVEADPALAEKVARHVQLKQMLGSHYAPILDEDVPDRLADMLKPKGEGDGSGSDAAEVVDLASRRTDPAPLRPANDNLRRWGWIAAPALAASLALALFLPQSGGSDDYADAELAGVLDGALVSTQAADAETRVLLSFRDEAGEYCRAYTSSDASGIACRDDNGWALVSRLPGMDGQSGEYRQAGSVQAELLAQAQEMATGPALDADAESAALEAGWQD